MHIAGSLLLIGTRKSFAEGKIVRWVQRKQAWISFGISLIYNLICETYFNVRKSNIFYSGCFFMAGGLIYLCKEQLKALFVKPNAKADGG